MDLQPLSPVLLPTGVTAAVVQAFDQQMLACVEDEALSAAQQAELLAWAHGHLLVDYVVARLAALPVCGDQSATNHLITHGMDVIDTIGNMLQGGVPLEEDLTFHCPPVCCERAHVLHGQLLAWVQKRVELAAQRTRWHTEAELTLLWQAIAAHLVAGSIVWFELAQWLEADVSAAATLEPLARGCLEAMCTGRGLAWTPAGAVLG